MNVRPVIAVFFALAPAFAEKVTLEIDNPWVHVTRVVLAPREKTPVREYAPSVIVYLTDTTAHRDGDTAHFEAGARAEENTTSHPVEEVIVEFKPGSPPIARQPNLRDPVKLDPEHHTVDFENDRARVLRTVLVPHVRSPMHDHPPYVVVYLTELHTKMALSDGRQVDNPRRKGEVAWRDAMHHSTENIGAEIASEIQVELK